MSTGKALISFGVLVFLVALSTRYGQSYQSGQDQQKYRFQSPEFYSSTLQGITKYRYRGAENCASVCHNNDTMGFQYDAWKKGPHAKAYLSLSSKKAKSYAREAGIVGDPHESSSCLSCHITGGGVDTTFLTSTYRKEDGVTCEACHKKKYVPTTFLPKEADCLECHDGKAHKMHKFNFEKGSLKIKHPLVRNNQKQGI